jgi:hypothetical protein
MNAGAEFPRLLGSRPGSGFVVLFTLLLLAVAGCVDRTAGPGGSYRTSLALNAVLSLASNQNQESIDGWRIQVLRPGEGVLAEESGTVAQDQSSVAVPEISVQLEAECEILRIRIELLAGTTVWWLSEADHQMCSGPGNQIGVTEEDFWWAGPPQPSLTTGALNFVLPQGSEASQSFSITYGGPGGLNWNLDIEGAGAEWLSMAPPTGVVSANSPQLITATVDASGLSVGTYSARLILHGFPGPSQTVDVTADVVPGPSIGLSPSSLTFSGEEGASPSPQTFTLSNQGGASMNWSAAPSESWLSVEPSSGALGPGQSTTVTVTVGATGLGDGEFQGNVVVQSPNADNSPQTLPVSLSLSPVFESVITGTVSVEGTPLSGVPVTLSGTASAQTETGAGGGFSFSGLQDGPYTLTLSGVPQDVVFEAVSVGVDLGVRETRTVDFTGAFLRTASVVGRVTVEGAGIGGVTVAANGPDGPVFRVTGESGNYAFSGLRGGSYTVAVSGFPAGVEFPAASQQVNLSSGHTATVNFAGVYDRTASILGQVTVDLSPAPDVTVTMHGPDGVGSYVTGADGRYSFTNLRAGTYTVGISGYPAGAEFGQTTVELDVAPGSTNTVDFPGETVAQLQVTPTSLTFTAGPESQPEPQTFQIRNTGGGPVDWWSSQWSSGSGCVTGLILSPTSGSLEAGQFINVQVQLNTMACPAGPSESNRSFTIYGSDGTSFPFSLEVQVTLSPSPTIYDERYSRVCVNCCITDPDGDWYKETVDYLDLEGDVDPAKSWVYATWMYSDETSGNYTYPPGSDYVTFTGDGFSGTVTTDPCYNFLDGQRSWVDVTLTLRDGSGNYSNLIYFRITPG